MLILLGLRSTDLFVLHPCFSIVFQSKLKVLHKMQVLLFTYLVIDVKHRSGGLILRFVMLYRCRFAWNDLFLMWCSIHLVFYDVIRVSTGPPRASKTAFLVACPAKMAILWASWGPLAPSWGLVEALLPLSWCSLEAILASSCPQEGAKRPQDCLKKAPRRPGEGAKRRKIVSRRPQ